MTRFGTSGSGEAARPGCPAGGAFDPAPCLRLLAAWAPYAERDWYDLPGVAGLGCYGSGYNAWGVQTNQKYLGAMAALAALPGEAPTELRARAGARALAALRFSLASHLSGPLACTDGTKWGNTWISALGIERMMYGVALLEPLPDEDRAALRRVLCHEADWLLLHHRRGRDEGIFADPWAASGHNDPESNLWNGALLWRASARYPDHPHAADWEERAHRFLLNAVSVAADAADATVVAGRPVRERHIGAQFFPHYALDHHGYLNVGYMVICLSNAAMLHFDLKAAGLPRPESLDHHQADLWRVVKRMIFADGRLCRIGGDSRVRYAYCQEYLLPALLYAADRFRDPHAPALAAAMVRMLATEAAASADGSFMGARLAPLRANPYYFCRLESDHAAVLGMAAAFAPRVEPPPAARASFERAVAGGWLEEEHGAALHRSPTRLASFAWRAHGLAQGMCLPPRDGHLAEWSNNLAGRIRLLGDPGPEAEGRHRTLAAGRVQAFEGGFAAWGAVEEGVKLTVAEGWSGSPALRHQIVFAALPDARTVVGLQFCRNGATRVFAVEVAGMLLNIPNDLFNGYRRTLAAAGGTIRLRSPARADGMLELGSRWAAIDNRIGAVGLYGAESLALRRSAARRGGRFASLHVEELGFPFGVGTRSIAPGEVVLDCGWAVLASVRAPAVRAFAEAHVGAAAEGLAGGLRAVAVTDGAGRRCVVAANFGDAAASLPATGLVPPGAVDLLSGRRVGSGEAPVPIEPGGLQVWRQA